MTHFCRHIHGPAAKMINNEVAPPCKPLSDSQRIRKVIQELIETERHYVKVRHLVSHKSLTTFYGRLMAIIYSPVDLMHGA